MLFALSQFKEIWFPVNVFQYITFRSGGAFLTALIIMLIFGQKFIDLVKRWEVTQTIRECGPQTHLKKAGTPTMGGLLILASLVFSTLLWARVNNRFIVITLLSAVYLGLLGFLDDYKKLILKHPSKGLSQSGKIFLQKQNTFLLGGGIDTNSIKSTKKLPPNIDVSSLNFGIEYEWNNTNYKNNPQKGSLRQIPSPKSET